MSFLKFVLNVRSKELQGVDIVISVGIVSMYLITIAHGLTIVLVKIISRYFTFTSLFKPPTLPYYFPYLLILLSAMKVEYKKLVYKIKLHFGFSI